MSKEQPILVAFIDHDKVFFEKSLALMRKAKDIDVCVAHLPKNIRGGDEEADAVMEDIRRCQPRVVFLSQMVIREAAALDLNTIIKLREQISTSRVVIIYDHYIEETAMIAIREGVCGLYERKLGPSKIVSCARAVARGEVWMEPLLIGRVIEEFSKLYRHVDSLQPPPRDHEARLALLTPREIEILRLISKSFTNADIGRALFISEKTVKTHIKNIFEKTGVRNRVEAVLLVVRSGLET